MNRSALRLFCFMILLASPVGAATPNLILIFCDDLGYGDLGCYGSTKNRTPRIDQLAAEGVRFTDFYSSSPVCTPSRSSLMTGCYARRVGMHEDATGHWVLIPRSRRGMHPDELTLPEVLKTKGYATACVGKWHLGDQPAHLPTEHGFDFYYGIPYSNDMQSKGRGDPPLPLLDGETVVETDPDLAFSRRASARWPEPESPFCTGRLLVNLNNRTVDKRIFEVGLIAQCLEQTLKNAGLGPATEPPELAVPVAKSWWQVTPRRPGANTPENGFKKQPVVFRRHPAITGLTWQVWLQPPPEA